MVDAQVSKYMLKLEVMPENEKLLGLCNLRILSGGDLGVKTVPFLLNKGLKVISVSAQNTELSFSQELTRFSDINDLIVNYVHVDLSPLPLSNNRLDLQIVYEGRIEPYANVFKYVQDRISEEHSLIRPDAFSYPVIGVPDFSKLIHMILSQTFEYELDISVPTHYVVANIGELVSREIKDDMIIYKYRSKLPSWRIDIAIARFETVYDDEKDIRIFALGGDVNHAERLLYETKRVLDFYIRNFGEPINWCGYTIIEIPSGWGSQADVCGMLLDKRSFVDKEAIGGLYHEIAHLWTIKTREKIPSRFLDEAFASYFQILAEKELLGKNLNAMLDRARKRFIQMCQKTPLLADVPIIKYGEYKVTDAVYYIGVWVLYLLNKIVGEECFKELIKRFISEYAEEGATIEDFISTCIRTCGEYTKRFLNDWLLETRGAKLLISGEPESNIVQLYIKR